MRIQLEAFAVLRDFLQEEMFEYEVPEGTTADQLIKQLAKSFPDAKHILDVTRLAHAEEYLHKDELIHQGETYSLIPPVSGG